MQLARSALFAAAVLDGLPLPPKSAPGVSARYPLAQRPSLQPAVTTPPAVAETTRPEKRVPPPTVGAEVCWYPGHPTAGRGARGWSRRFLSWSWWSKRCSLSGGRFVGRSGSCSVACAPWSGTMRCAGA